MSTSIFLLVGLWITTAAASASSIHVCCGCGNDSADGLTRIHPLNSLTAALQRVRLHQHAGPVDVFVAGSCELSSTLVFGPEDSGTSNGRILYRSYDGEQALVSGGLPVTESALQPVTDPAILAQLPPAARTSVLQLRLADVGAADAGELLCRAFLGGDACILPALLREAGLELFWAGDQTAGGAPSPLALARFPNRDFNTTNWSNVTALSGDWLGVDAFSASRLASWLPQLAAEPGSAALHCVSRQKRVYAFVLEKKPESRVPPPPLCPLPSFQS